MSAADEESGMVTSSGFRIVSRRQMHKRYLQVEDREVVYPDGRQAAFDIVGHKEFDLCFVVVFVRPRSLPPGPPCHIALSSLSPLPRSPPVPFACYYCGCSAS